jgi:leucyl aminopeptidase (aminopeptidase T)
MPPRPGTTPTRRSGSTSPLPDYSLLGAARRIVEGALGLVPGERIVIVVDEARLELANALEEAARLAGARATVLVLEEQGHRPLAQLPRDIADALAGSQASVLLTSAEPAEMRMRTELIRLTTKHALRHAHMVGVSREVMAAGLAIDPQRIAGVALALRARIRPASVIRVRSGAGTDLEIRCHPRFRWVENSGRIRPGRWENLPGGELVSTSNDISGTFVANGAMTGLPGLDEGLPLRTPIEIKVEIGRVRSVGCSTSSVARAIDAFIRSGRNFDRVGHFSFGTNIGLVEPTGSIIADQNLPGLHLALGMTYPEMTGADWDAEAQLILTGKGADIDIDGEPIMRSGRYVMR